MAGRWDLPVSHTRKTKGGEIPLRPQGFERKTSHLTDGAQTTALLNVSRQITGSISDKVTTDAETGEKLGSSELLRRPKETAELCGMLLEEFRIHLRH